jgi:hypothetical protein
MATGRTVIKYSKVYADGYDLTGYSRTFGPLTWSFEESDATTLGDAVKSAMPNTAMINIGAINAVLDNTTSASHDRLNGQATRTIMLPIGIRADPAQGDPVFCGVFMQKDFSTEATGNTAVTINAPFSGWAGEAATLLYSKPWGWLLHAKAAKTAINSSTGIDDYGAATAAGGYMVYQLFTSNGTVTLKTQDAATNADGSFADLASSGSLNASVTPAAGIVALSNTATVRRYLRWQLTFGTATTATFAIAFVRA